MTTKRQKLQAMADQTASPAEAEVAKSILAKTQDPLDRIADDIRAEWGRGIDIEFRIGELLAQAKGIFGDRRGGHDNEFGQWVRAQDFPFSASTAYNLRIGFERKDEVAAFLAARSQSLASSRTMGVNTAVSLMTRKPKDPLVEQSEGIDEAFHPQPADPAFAALRAAHHRILGIEFDDDGAATATANAFLTMHVDDLVASAGYIKALAEAYQAAKSARS